MPYKLTVNSGCNEPSAKKALTLLDGGRARPVYPTISNVCSEISKKAVNLGLLAADAAHPLEEMLWFGVYRILTLAFPELSSFLPYC